MGLTFFLAVFLFTWAGIWLDGRLDTAPLFTLLGLAIGFAGGLYSILRELYGSGRNK